jgi:hypothetical protein
MTGHRLSFNAHGSNFHSTAIAIATLIAHKRKYKILDGKVFRDKYYYKAEPDVYFEVPIKGTDEHGRKYVGTKRYVVEIETLATSASVKRKTAQFHTSITNHELIVIRLNDYTDKIPLADLWKVIEGRMP